MPMAASVVRRCPDCGGKFKMIFNEGPIFERCINCGHVLLIERQEDYDG